MKYIIGTVLIILAFATGLFLGSYKAAEQIIVDHSCPNWICTTRTDTRSMQEYIEECDPQPYRFETGMGIWCSKNNPIDRFNQPPKGAIKITWEEYEI